MKRKLSLISLALVLICSDAFAVSSPTCFDTDTKLMIHLNTNLTDSSTSGKTVTAGGDAAVTAAQKQFGAGSVVMDGAGDYLTSADSDDWNLGAGNFTIDFWVRWNALPSAGNNMWLVSQRVDNNNEIQFFITNTGGIYSLTFQAFAGAASVVSSGANVTISTGTWYHIAAVRNGSNIYVYLDGTQSSTAAFSLAMPDLASELEIGRRNAAGSEYYHNGWIDEFRWVKGTAVWTAAFTKPSAEYSSDCTISTTTAKYGRCGVGVSGTLQVF